MLSKLYFLFQTSSIERKLVAAIAGTAFFTLVLTSLVFFLHIESATRKHLIGQAELLIEALEPKARAALAFQDESAARQALAIIANDSRVVEAAILGRPGNTLARYRRGEGRGPGLAAANYPRQGYAWRGGLLLLTRPLRGEGQAAGEVRIALDVRSSGNTDSPILLWSALIGIFLIACVLAFALQRKFSKPLSELVSFGKTLADEKNYSLRLKASRSGDFFQLARVLNTLAEEVETRQEEALAARRMAAAASHARDSFLANVSDELRAPLKVILSQGRKLGEALEGGESAPAEAASPAGRARGLVAAGKTLLGLIDGILELSKKDTGLGGLDLEAFPVQALVAELAASIDAQVRAAGSSLEVHCPADTGVMYSDRAKTRQLVHDLLANATRLTDQGRIRMEILREPGKRCDWIVFRVSSAGIALDGAQVEGLFQPFSRSSAREAAGDGGSGLGIGLALAKRFAGLLGGEISAESEPWKGTTFSVRLPSQVIRSGPRKGLAVAGTGSDEEWHRTVSGRPERAAETSLALVVAQDPSAQEVISGVLRQEGFEVVQAFTLEEGLRRARELGPDLVLLDVELPKGDGWGLLRALKQDAALEKVPVVAISRPAEREHGLELGAADTLVKPVSRERLATVVARYRDGLSVPRALLVEDSAEARAMLRFPLEQTGWAVSEAENGLVALRMVSRIAPQLIVLDLMMPELDGFGFLRELHKTPAWRDIPVVVLTSRVLSNGERERLSGEVTTILEKGTHTLEELRTEVRELARALLPAEGEPASESGESG